MFAGTMNALPISIYAIPYMDIVFDHASCHYAPLELAYPAPWLRSLKKYTIT